MKRRHLTLIRGGSCDCDDCRTKRLLIAVALLATAASGLVWLFLGAE